MRIKTFAKALMLAALLVAGRTVVAAPVGVDLADCAGWNIVVNTAATPSEQYAAEEFQHHFQEATGIQLPIVDSASAADGHVFLGAGQTMQASAVGFKVDGFGDEDYRIVVRDQNIAIAGGRPRGTLYGIYAFLEDYLGVRFLTHDHTHIPTLDRSHVVGPIDRTYHPPLEFRWSFYGETSAYPVFATRQRVNTITDDPRLGGKTGRRLINHSFYRQIPSAKYGKEHPEYYCEIDGKRRAIVDHDYDGSGNQPCLSNPEVLKIVTASVLAELKANPTAENVALGQNDNRYYCRCAECAAIDEREGSPMGSLLTFVNAAASEIEKEFPHVKVGTLSYSYSRKPPRTIRPRSNVQIQLCSIECCLIHPIDDPDCPLNTRFCADMKRWNELSDDLAIWNYNTNFNNYLLPCPNLRVIEPNVRYFVANGAKGIFMQAAGRDSLGAEFSDLRNYLISGLLWDPTRSGQSLIDEFLTLHYGEAAPPIRRFLDLVHDTAEQSGRHKNCYGALGHYGMDESIGQAGLAAFAEAMQLASSDAIKQRVAKASICAYRAAIEPVWLLRLPWVLRKPSEIDAELKPRLRPLVREFFELCEAHGVTRVSEYRTLAEAKQQMRKLFELAEGEEF